MYTVLNGDDELQNNQQIGYFHPANKLFAGCPSKPLMCRAVKKCHWERQYI
jgi:hypothetical protein